MVVVEGGGWCVHRMRGGGRSVQKDGQRCVCGGGGEGIGGRIGIFLSCHAIITIVAGLRLTIKEK